RRYLKARLQARGMKSEAARAMNCQPAYLSRVLADQATLSSEQAFSLNIVLNHKELESEYFLALVDYERAGTAEFRSYLKAKLDRLKAQSMELKQRIRAAPKMDQ